MIVEMMELWVKNEVIVDLKRVGLFVKVKNNKA